MFCFGRPIVHQFPTAGVALLPPSDRSDSYNLHRIGNDGIGKFHPDGISRSAFPLPAFEPYGKGTVFAENSVDLTLEIDADLDDMLVPLPTVCALQLIAYYTSVLRGIDPDKPRNLAKAVTTE